MISARRFPRVPESVPTARRFIRETLRGQPVELVDTVELMVSELAANCVLHARTDFEVAVSLQDRLRIEVRDDSGAHPELQSPAPEDRSGRGLRIVQALADSWGIAWAPSGKTVWAVLELPSSRSDDPSRARATGGQQRERGVQRVDRDERRGGPAQARAARRTPRACRTSFYVCWRQPLDRVHQPGDTEYRRHRSRQRTPSS